MKEIDIQPLDPGRFEGVLEPEPARRFARLLDQAADRLAGRHLWHVNSTEAGGGVAEMLHFLLGYLTGAGIDARWVVLEGNEDFYQVTKRLHHLQAGQGTDAAWTRASGGSTSRPRRRRSPSWSDGSVLATWWSCTIHRPSVSLPS